MYINVILYRTYYYNDMILRRQHFREVTNYSTRKTV